MRPEIEEIYEIEVRSRSADPRYANVVQTIVGFHSVVEMRIRWDAVYFLANNLIDMVSTPIEIARLSDIILEGPAVVPEQLPGLYTEDLQKVVTAAADVAKERGRNEISSTSALLGLARTIGELRIDDLQIWGRSSE